MADQPSPQAPAAPLNSDPAPQAPAQPDPSQASEPTAGGYRDEVTEALAAAAAKFEGEQPAPEASEEPPPSGGTEAGKGPASDKRPEARTEEVPASAPPPSDKVKASQFATFHRQQKEFLAQKQAQQAKLDQAEKLQAALDNAKADPIAAMEAMGYSDVKSFLERLAEDGGRLTPERKELAELKAWRKDFEAKQESAQKQAAEAQQQAQHQAKLASLRSDIQNQIKSETYASRLINLPGADDQVMVEMNRLAEETGEMPRVSDAIEAVEGRFRTYLEDMAKNPEIVAFFQKRASAGKSALGADSQSKGREKSQTIGAETRSPGLTPTPKRRLNRYGDEDDVAEAIDWLSGAG